MDGEITPEAVNDLLEDDDETLRVIDIRDPTSFDRGYIPDSENVPFHELPQRVESVADDDVDRIVTVCPHGKASVQAARLIGSYEGCADTTVESMAGGLEAWSQECGLELVATADSSSNPSTSAVGARTASTGDDSGSDSNSDTPDAPF
ncbi:rhodanese-like domain-containing protein [Halobacteria archaeon AArc-m2/3/4]|uniref:Rhodanese-like domain-containing protein n=1 Tax=Natronoglomus mannanivorans TaxID=2979990 RepID=A0ABT2QHM4_9EURY|nr:rhodanese-like domain-containing protein [Halobacteria archaeon AArc-m2/3/4]